MRDAACVVAVSSPVSQCFVTAPALLSGSNLKQTTSTTNCPFLCAAPAMLSASVFCLLLQGWQPGSGSSAGAAGWIVLGTQQHWQCRTEHQQAEGPPASSMGSFQLWAMQLILLASSCNKAYTGHSANITLVCCGVQTCPRYVESAEGHNATALGAMVSFPEILCLVSNVDPRPAHGTGIAPASTAAAVSLLAPLFTCPCLSYRF